MQKKHLELVSAFSQYTHQQYIFCKLSVLTVHVPRVYKADRTAMDLDHSCCSSVQQEAFFSYVKKIKALALKQS